MARKLAAEDKAANKKATHARQKAYYARGQAYRTAREQAEQAAERAPEAVEFAAACAESEALAAAFTTEDRALATQIEALEALRKRLRADFDARAETAKQHRHARRRAYMAAKERLLAPVEKEFSDVAHCYGPASWKPLEAFKDAS